MGGPIPLRVSCTFVSLKILGLGGRTCGFAVLRPLCCLAWLSEPPLHPALRLGLSAGIRGPRAVSCLPVPGDHHTACLPQEHGTALSLPWAEPGLNPPPNLHTTLLPAHDLLSPPRSLSGEAVGRRPSFPLSSHQDHFPCPCKGRRKEAYSTVPTREPISFTL